MPIVTVRERSTGTPFDIEVASTAQLTPQFINASIARQRESQEIERRARESAISRSVGASPEERASAVRQYIPPVPSIPALVASDTMSTLSSTVPNLVESGAAAYQIGSPMAAAAYARHAYESARAGRAPMNPASFAAQMAESARFSPTVQAAKDWRGDMAKYWTAEGAEQYPELAEMVKPIGTSIGSALQFAATMPTGVAGLVGMGAGQTFGPRFSELREQGVSPERSLAQAGIESGLEAASEYALGAPGKALRTIGARRAATTALRDAERLGASTVEELAAMRRAVREGAPPVIGETPRMASLRQAVEREAAQPPRIPTTTWEKASARVRTVNDDVKNYLKPILESASGELGISMLSEGVEENISGILGDLSAVYLTGADPNALKDFAKKRLQEFVGGAIGGAVFGAASVPGQRATRRAIEERKTRIAEIRAAITQVQDERERRRLAAQVAAEEAQLRRDEAAQPPVAAGPVATGTGAPTGNVPSVRIPTGQPPIAVGPVAAGPVQTGGIGPALAGEPLATPEEDIGERNKRRDAAALARWGQLEAEYKARAAAQGDTPQAEVQSKGSWMPTYEQWLAGSHPWISKAKLGDPMNPAVVTPAAAGPSAGLGTALAGESLATPAATPPVATPAATPAQFTPPVPGTKITVMMADGSPRVVTYLRPEGQNPNLSIVTWPDGSEVYVDNGSIVPAAATPAAATPKRRMLPAPRYTDGGRRLPGKPITPARRMLPAPRYTDEGPGRPTGKRVVRKAGPAAPVDEGEGELGDALDSDLYFIQQMKMANHGEAEIRKFAEEVKGRLPQVKKQEVDAFVNGLYPPKAAATKRKRKMAPAKPAAPAAAAEAPGKKKEELSEAERWLAEGNKIVASVGLPVADKSLAKKLAAQEKAIARNKAKAEKGEGPLAAAAQEEPAPSGGLSNLGEAFDQAVAKDAAKQAEALNPRATPPEPGEKPKPYQKPPPNPNKEGGVRLFDFMDKDQITALIQSRTGFLLAFAKQTGAYTVDDYLKGLKQLIDMAKKEGAPGEYGLRDDYIAIALAAHENSIKKFKEAGTGGLRRDSIKKISETIGYWLATDADLLPTALQINMRDNVPLWQRHRLDRMAAEQKEDQRYPYDPRFGAPRGTSDEEKEEMEKAMHLQPSEWPLARPFHGIPAPWEDPQRWFDDILRYSRNGNKEMQQTARWVFVTFNEGPETGRVYLLPVYRTDDTKKRVDQRVMIGDPFAKREGKSNTRKSIDKWMGKYRWNKPEFLGTMRIPTARAEEWLDPMEWPMLKFLEFADHIGNLQKQWIEDAFSEPALYTETTTKVSRRKDEGVYIANEDATAEMEAEANAQERDRLEAETAGVVEAGETTGRIESQMEISRARAELEATTTKEEREAIAREEGIPLRQLEAEMERDITMADVARGVVNSIVEQVDTPDMPTDREGVAGWARQVMRDLLFGGKTGTEVTSDMKEVVRALHDAVAEWAEAEQIGGGALKIVKGVPVNVYTDPEAFKEWLVEQIGDAATDAYNEAAKSELLREGAKPGERASQRGIAERFKPGLEKGVTRRLFPAVGYRRRRGQGRRLSPREAYRQLSEEKGKALERAVSRRGRLFPWMIPWMDRMRLLPSRVRAKETAAERIEELRRMRMEARREEEKVRRGRYPKKEAKSHDLEPWELEFTWEKSSLVPLTIAESQRLVEGELSTLPQPLLVNATRDLSATTHMTSPEHPMGVTPSSGAPISAWRAYRKWREKHLKLGRKGLEAVPLLPAAKGLRSGRWQMIRHPKIQTLVIRRSALGNLQQHLSPEATVKVVRKVGTDEVLRINDPTGIPYWVMPRSALAEHVLDREGEITDRWKGVIRPDPRGIMERQQVSLNKEAPKFTGTVQPVYLATFFDPELLTDPTKPALKQETTEVAALNTVVSERKKAEELKRKGVKLAPEAFITHIWEEPTTVRTEVITEEGERKVKKEKFLRGEKVTRSELIKAKLNALAAPWASPWDWKMHEWDTYFRWVYGDVLGKKKTEEHEEYMQAMLSTQAGKFDYTYETSVLTEPEAYRYWSTIEKNENEARSILMSVAARIGIPIAEADKLETFAYGNGGRLVSLEERFESQVESGQMKEGDWISYPVRQRISQSESEVTKQLRMAAALRSKTEVTEEEQRRRTPLEDAIKRLAIDDIPKTVDALVQRMDVHLEASRAALREALVDLKLLGLDEVRLSDDPTAKAMVLSVEGDKTILTLNRDKVDHLDSPKVRAMLDEEVKHMALVAFLRDDLHLKPGSLQHKISRHLRELRTLIPADKLSALEKGMEEAYPGLVTPAAWMMELLRMASKRPVGGGVGLTEEVTFIGTIKENLITFFRRFQSWLHRAFADKYTDPKTGVTEHFMPEAIVRLRDQVDNLLEWTETQRRASDATKVAAPGFVDEVKEGKPSVLTAGKTEVSAAAQEAAQRLQSTVFNKDQYDKFKASSNVGPLGQRILEEHTRAQGLMVDPAVTTMINDLEARATAAPPPKGTPLATRRAMAKDRRRARMTLAGLGTGHTLRSLAEARNIATATPPPTGTKLSAWERVLAGTVKATELSDDEIAEIIHASAGVTAAHERLMADLNGAKTSLENLTQAEADALSELQTFLKGATEDQYRQRVSNRIDGIRDSLVDLVRLKARTGTKVASTAFDPIDWDSTGMAEDKRALEGAASLLGQAQSLSDLKALFNALAADPRLDPASIQAAFNGLIPTTHDFFDHISKTGILADVITKTGLTKSAAVAMATTSLAGGLPPLQAWSPGYSIILDLQELASNFAVDKAEMQALATVLDPLSKKNPDKFSVRRALNNFRMVATNSGKKLERLRRLSKASEVAALRREATDDAIKMMESVAASKDYRAAVNQAVALIHRRANDIIRMKEPHKGEPFGSVTLVMPLMERKDPATGQTIEDREVRNFSISVMKFPTEKARVDIIQAITDITNWITANYNTADPVVLQSYEQVIRELSVFLDPQNAISNHTIDEAGLFWQGAKGLINLDFIREILNPVLKDVEDSIKGFGRHVYSKAMVAYVNWGIHEQGLKRKQGIVFEKIFKAMEGHKLHVEPEIWGDLIRNMRNPQARMQADRDAYRWLVTEVILDSYQEAYDDPVVAGDRLYDAGRHISPTGWITVSPADIAAAHAQAAYERGIGKQVSGQTGELTTETADLLEVHEMAPGKAEAYKERKRLAFGGGPMIMSRSLVVPERLGMLLEDFRKARQGQQQRRDDKNKRTMVADPTGFRADYINNVLRHTDEATKPLTFQHLVHSFIMTSNPRYRARVNSQLMGANAGFGMEDYYNELRRDLKKGKKTVTSFNEIIDDLTARVVASGKATGTPAEIRQEIENEYADKLLLAQEKMDDFDMQRQSKSSTSTDTKSSFITPRGDMEAPSGFYEYGLTSHQAMNTLHGVVLNHHSTNLAKAMSVIDAVVVAQISEANKAVGTPGGKADTLVQKKFQEETALNLEELERIHKIMHQSVALMEEFAKASLDPEQHIHDTFRWGSMLGVAPLVSGLWNSLSVIKDTVLTLTTGIYRQQKLLWSHVIFPLCTAKAVARWMKNAAKITVYHLSNTRAGRTKWLRAMLRHIPILAPAYHKSVSAIVEMSDRGIIRGMTLYDERLLQKTSGNIWAVTGALEYERGQSGFFKGVERWISTAITRVPFGKAVIWATRESRTIAEDINNMTFADTAVADLRRLKQKALRALDQRKKKGVWTDDPLDPLYPFTEKELGMNRANVRMARRWLTGGGSLESVMINLYNQTIATGKSMEEAVQTELPKPAITAWMNNYLTESQVQTLRERPPVAFIKGWKGKVARSFAALKVWNSANFYSIVTGEIFKMPRHKMPWYYRYPREIANILGLLFLLLGSGAIGTLGVSWGLGALGLRTPGWTVENFIRNPDLRTGLIVFTGALLASIPLGQFYDDLFAGFGEGTLEIGAFSPVLGFLADAVYAFKAIIGGADFTDIKATKDVIMTQTGKFLARRLPIVGVLWNLNDPAHREYREAAASIRAMSAPPGIVGTLVEAIPGIDYGTKIAHRPFGQVSQNPASDNVERAIKWGIEYERTGDPEAKRKSEEEKAEGIRQLMHKKGIDQSAAAKRVNQAVASRSVWRMYDNVPEEDEKEDTLKRLTPKQFTAVQHREAAIKALSKGGGSGRAASWGGGGGGGGGGGIRLAKSSSASGKSAKLPAVRALRRAPAVAVPKLQGGRQASRRSLLGRRGAGRRRSASDRGLLRYAVGRSRGRKMRPAAFA